MIGFLVLLFLVILLGGALILQMVVRSRAMISRSLNLALIAVRFSQPPPQELSLQQIRERIGLMEQFYSHLALVKDKWWRVFL